MSANLEPLIRMANQIAANLAHEDNPAAATADHIRQFWDPRMRREIVAHLEAGGAGLDPQVAEAIRLIASEDASPAPSP